MNCQQIMSSFTTIISLIADIATCLGMVSVFILLWNIQKNKINKRHVQCKPIIRDNAVYALQINNFTENTFYITGIYLIKDKEEIPAVGFYGNEPFRFTRNLKNVEISSFEAVELDISFRTTLPKKGKIKICTTKGILKYKIYGNPNENADEEQPKEYDC